MSKTNTKTATGPFPLLGDGTKARARGTYSWKQGKYRSVTTIIGAVKGEALVRWAANSVANGVADLLKSYDLTTEQIASAQQAGDEEGASKLKQYGMTGKRLMDCLRDTYMLSQIPWSIRDQAGSRGTRLHTLAQDIVMGNLPDLSGLAEDEQGRAAGFVQWWQQNQPTLIASECMVLNRALGYAGTLDLIVELQGETWLLDVKTSKDTYDSNAFQLAAYRNAEVLCIPGTDEEYPLPEIQRTGVLLVHAAGTRLMEWQTGPTSGMLEAFLACKAIDSMNQTKPRPEEVAAQESLGVTCAGRRQAPGAKAWVEGVERMEVSHIRKAWGILWKSGYPVECHLMGTPDHPSRTLLFETRREAREERDRRWGYLRQRPDLRRAPFHWRMPRVVRVEVSVRMLEVT